MKTLYVLRHAKTEIGGMDMQDFDRALTERGKKNAASVGTLFSQENWQPDAVLCSSATRTRQTAQLVNEQQKQPFEITHHDSLYLASFGDLLHHIQELDNAHHSAMLVGHNPGLHQLCLTLAARSEFTSDLAVKFPTSALAIITANVDHWEEIAPGCGTLEAYLDRHDVKQKLN